MQIDEMLSKLRNPYGRSKDEVRAARLAAADYIEKSKQILNPRLWDMETHVAWHKNIPDMKKAFDAIRELTHSL